MLIAIREKLTISAAVVDQLVQGANCDMRQVLNMLSTWKLSSDSMDFDEGKQLCVHVVDLGLLDLILTYSAASNQKHTIMTPYSVTEKILGPYVFSRTSRETLHDKMEYYFHDHSFVPLFIQVRSFMNGSSVATLMELIQGKLPETDSSSTTWFS